MIIKKLEFKPMKKPSLNRSCRIEIHDQAIRKASDNKSARTGHIRQ